MSLKRWENKRFHSLIVGLCDNQNGAFLPTKVTDKLKRNRWQNWPIVFVGGESFGVTNAKARFTQKDCKRLQAKDR